MISQVIHILSSWEFANNFMYEISFKMSSTQDAVNVFKCLSFMALYGSAINQPGNITPHSRARCSLVHLGVGLGWQTFCSSPVEKISALNQSGNITPHSNARCSIRHLGLGLGGQNFRYNLMEKIVNVANPSLVRIKQQGMVYFSRIAICEIP